MVGGDTRRQATEVAKSDSKQAERILKEIMASKSGMPDATLHEEATGDQEAALMQLAQLYQHEGNAEVLADGSPARTARLRVHVLDGQGKVCQDRCVRLPCLSTALTLCLVRIKLRIFLAQSLEIRLATLVLETRAYRDGLAIHRRLDDKIILTELHLLESKLHQSTQNLPKAKAALTSSRTAASSIYCPPYLQAQLDMQSGLLLEEEKDYKMGTSVLRILLAALKYLLLCKIMLNAPEDVSTIMNVDAMTAIAAAHQARNQQALKDYQPELQSDPTIRAHLSAFYDTLLEQNLLKIIEPFSRVEIAHVPSVVGQPVSQVELKLSQMILDKVFDDTLDQGVGCLVVYDEPEEDHVGNVVDSLYYKVSHMIVGLFPL
ncbi:PCI-domain-containing protein [Calocera cornea HHB12733]|uniref:PCI-domain-containing protein n=1 Tax=Calocera cornea HHB12733 TaxID=1353952 RepID=A0A165CFL9_9BASI|nr:PCI-domain-containing protein [Calocera cornea HHB12733]